MPYTGDPLIDERLDLIRTLPAGLDMLEKGRTERAAMPEFLARLDHAIAGAEENVRSLGERLVGVPGRGVGAEGGRCTEGGPRADRRATP
jgi:hypothetical protein